MCPGKRCPTPLLSHCSNTTINPYMVRVTAYDLRSLGRMLLILGIEACWNEQ